MYFILSCNSTHPFEWTHLPAVYTLASCDFFAANMYFHTTTQVYLPSYKIHLQLEWLLVIVDTNYEKSTCLTWHFSYAPWHGVSRRNPLWQFSNKWLWLKSVGVKTIFQSLQVCPCQDHRGTIIKIGGSKITFLIYVESLLDETIL